MDFKSPNLLLHIAKKLWLYKLVSSKGKTYSLTRLGFGLNAVPKIKATVLKTVLMKRNKTKGLGRFGYLV